MAQVKLLKIASGIPTEHSASADDLSVLSLSSDTINERTATAGVTIDGVLLKDSGATFGANVVMGDFSVTGVDTITFTDVNGTIAGIENQNLVDKAAAESITGAWDFGGATSLEIPNGTSGTTDAAGEIYLDTNGNGSTITTGVIQVFDGTQNTYVVSATNYPTSDNDVPAYDSGTNSVVWQAQTGGVDPNLETYTSSSTVAKGDVVYMTSTNDTVALADADTVSNGTQMVGLANEAITASSSGSIFVARGKVITGVLTAATAGTIYYLSTSGTTGNTLTTTAPSGGPALVRIGVAKNATDLIFDPSFIADTTA